MDAAEACGARYSANAGSSAMTRFLLLPTPTMFTTGLCSATTGFITPLWTPLVEPGRRQPITAAFMVLHLVLLASSTLSTVVAFAIDVG